MRVTRSILVAAFVAVFASSAQAALIEFQDVYTPVPSPMLDDTHDSYAYTHYITLQPAHPGTNVLTTTVDGAIVSGADYDSVTDTLAQGMLSLFFDVSLTNQGRFDLLLDGLNFLDNQLFAATVTVGTAQFSIGLLAIDGVLGVLIDRTNASGQVILTQSILTVNGGRLENGNVEPPPSTSVPEPVLLVLFGAGLLALASQRRLQGRSGR